MKKIFLTIFLISLICLTGVAYGATTNDEFKLDIIKKVNVEDPLFSEQEIIEENQSTDTVSDDDFIESIRNEFREDNIVYDDLYLIDEKVTINYHISGNVYVIAKEINVENANIDGNVFLITEKLTLKDTNIQGVAYIIAQEFESNSYIKDLYLLGNELEFQENSYISRSARVIGEKIIVNGDIQRNCYFYSDNIEMKEDAKIGGTLSYYSSKEANILNKENIGNIEFHKQEVNDEEETKSATIADKTFNLISSIVEVTIIAGAWILLSSKIINNNKDMKVGNFFKALGIGTLIFFIIPIIAILLIISIVGLGIGLIVLAIYAILLYMSAIVACLAIASRIVKKDSKWLVLGVTILIYLAVQIISIFSAVGILISMILGLAGLGFMVKNICCKNKEKEAIQEVL